jgi:hypothetical protein
MFSLPPETSSMIFGMTTKDALLSLGVLVGPVLGYFAAQSTAFAKLQKITFDASGSFLQQAQSQHSADLVRISELEGEVLRQRGEINQHIQVAASSSRAMERKQRFIDDLIGLCADHKIKIPSHWHD